ncbi:MAG: hypothetical protein ACP5FL_03975 [Thermoplasmatota archaeon]
MHGRYVLVACVLVVALCAGNGLSRPLSDDAGPEPVQPGVWLPSVSDGGAVPAGFGSSSNFATRAITCYNGDLYVGTQNVDFSRIDRLFDVKRLSTLGLASYRLLEAGGSVLPMLRLAPWLVPMHGMYSQGCEIWRYRDVAWAPMVSDAPGAAMAAGFGDSGSFAASILQPFNGDLYVGTSASSLKGCQVWRFDGSTWQLVVDGGFGSRDNSGIWSSAVFQGYLYLGTMNWKEGCQVYRTTDGVTWEKMRLPGGDGFGSRTTIYAWDMGVYRDALYLGTCNLDSRGGQLWRFSGTEWEKVALPGGDGFGNPANYGIRNLVVYRDDLYVGVATSFAQRREGAELWKYNGWRWRQVIGEYGWRNDGFGDTSNKYIWSLIVVGDALWAGTLNLEPSLLAGPLLSSGCEIWRYDGWHWENIVGRWHGEAPAGFGDCGNVGARSMLEYPEDSGTLWVGTWQFDMEDYERFAGCQIWQRVPPDGKPR